MFYRALADAIVIFHFLFVLFVLFGGLIVLRWPKVMWLHLPAALWGVVVEWTGWLCPLTPLENTLRTWSGGDGYEGGFVDHYILPLLYTEELLARFDIGFRSFQLILGGVVLALNLTVYGLIVRRAYKGRHADGSSASAPQPGADSGATPAHPLS